MTLPRAAADGDDHLPGLGPRTASPRHTSSPRPRPPRLPLTLRRTAPDRATAVPSTPTPDLRIASCHRLARLRPGPDGPGAADGADATKASPA
ncbi:hypothetical protein MUU72_26585 [Streptomyces sp. RS10V-4]|uniref:hypothetical protein n=1 Tax=Streptomyces rhizoryzae TaxID=2932493 RepID=UPI00200405FC|nr:hypothetical protein [Streptomyces rhizoryzae]MCK7626626.1 hypothetical protein [Streptomyces rhizoryzae]